MGNENGAGRQGGGGFLAGFVVGTLVGGALAMMLAPQTGEETRDVVFGKAREAANFAKDATGDFRERVSGVATDLQSNAADLYEKGRSAVENARTQMGAASEEAKAAADSTRGNLSSQPADASTGSV